MYIKEYESHSKICKIIMLMNEVIPTQVWELSVVSFGNVFCIASLSIIWKATS